MKSQTKKMCLDVQMSVAWRRASDSATVSSCEGLKSKKKKMRLDVDMSVA